LAAEMGACTSGDREAEIERSKQRIENENAEAVKATGMATAEVQEVREIFDGIDENLNGRITLKEMRAAAERKAQDSSLNASAINAQVMDQMKEMDLDDDKMIGFVEFAKWYHKSTAQDKLRKEFQAMDTDGDGLVSIDELGAAYEIFGEERQKLFDKVDANKDGKIQFEEFAKIMTQGGSWAAKSPKSIDVNYQSTAQVTQEEAPAAGEGRPEEAPAAGEGKPKAAPAAGKDKALTSSFQ